MQTIKSSADLRNNYNEILTFCHKYTEPLFITKNRKGDDSAVMSIEAYEELNSRIELYGLIKDGMDDIADGKTHSCTDVTIESLNLTKYNFAILFMYKERCFMRKFITTYIPFLIYFLCVALAYFVFFYLLPEYSEVLVFFGFLIIYAYIYIGMLFLGYFMGKITVRRMNHINILQCLLYSLFSFCLMLLIGFLKHHFYINMHNNSTFTFSCFIHALDDPDTLYISIGTLISFLIGEFVECMRIFFNDINRQEGE